ncbi:MAG TPA: small basic family protein [Fimbriimonadaceae bacterium]|nr:small basic family protein [Fimbriimonadaceae bacterium]
MIFLLPVVGLVLGALLAIALKVGPQGGWTGQYMAVACLAGLDTICGGIRSGLEGKYTNEVFISGFISNIVIAFFLAWLGDRIGIDLFLAVALVLGARIFTNLSLIRRYLLTKWQDAKERKRLQQLAAQAQAQAQMQADAAG